MPSVTTDRKNPERPSEMQSEITEKPLISILMAVYEPRMDWLGEQLDSLNAQTYPHLRLYIRDDCSTTVSYEDIRHQVEDRITAFPFTIERNEKNLGSNAVFESMIREAEGDYFAFCDQDDIWFPEKLETMHAAMEREGAVLACSDMVIIDTGGKQIASSITKVRKRHVFRSGEGLAPSLLVRNFVTGCAGLFRADIAKAAIPVCPDMVHDHYLAMCEAREGKIVSLPDRLIRYRIHGQSQTRVMAGVTDKESYYHIRIESMVRRLKWLQSRFSEDESLSEEIAQALCWAEARSRSFRGDRTARKTVWNYRRFSPTASLFEVVMADKPEWLFMWCIRLIRKNLI